ncbi:TonB-dependent receptor [Reichenbachiella agarivorans]|uniref:TonB-dependent receptor n=1 Tax=Reichenbachiella agarivorans TaxID=2979464 RepID=A0ABY6CLH0_9BACT|nr:TonB-dependent receptor [Reichenbachiella agarivorans]UXP31372.1 TonB-dependent receptor [Reichenbachiella agarivorans]
MRTLLERVLPAHNISISYHDNIVPLDKSIVFDSKITRLKFILTKICENENLNYEVVNDQIVLKYYERPKSEYKYTIDGVIKDIESGEILIGASVYIKEIASGVSSNAYGYYSLTLPRGKYEVEVRYIGYETKYFSIDMFKNVNNDIELKPQSIEMESLQIDERNPMDIKAHSILSSTNRIDMEMAERIPYLGEVDVFQGSLLLPGITNIGEGVSGVNVRGGSSDQNLVMLDEAVLYSSNHFFGLISVFNPDAVSDVEILKGDFPAKYGGRNSSVMHVRQKEGNENDFHVSGGLGLITSRLMVEGPALDQKLTYLFSARSTFWDLILRNLSDPLFNDIRANFQDVNGKFKYNINSNNKVYLSGYWGADATKYGTDALQKWGNSISSLRWNHIWKNKHFFNTTFYHSGYRYSVIETQEFRDYEGRATINDYALKMDVTSYLNPRNILDWGVSAIWHDLLPGELVSGSLDTSGDDVSLPDERGLESAIYVSSENRIGSRLTSSLGFRLTNFRNQGASDVYVYQENQPKSHATIVDTLRANTKENVKSYWRLLPRGTLKFQLGENSSTKLSYTSSIQYMHLLSNTTSPSSSDAWVMSGYNILPTFMQQYTTGIYRYFPLIDMNASVELYYRNSEDVVEYKNGANLVFNQTVETELIYGSERAYGVEFFVKKTFGRWTGWAGYTLSKVERKFENKFEELEINEGNYYPSDYDRTHDFALTVVFEMNKRWSISSNFVYYTGRPYSFPDSKYEIDGILVPNYPDRNHDRLSNYHRLDLAATYQISPYKKSGEKRKYESDLVFSVYNLYGRKNTQAYFFTADEDNPNQSSTQKLSVLAFPVPSITYNFRF